MMDEATALKVYAALARIIANREGVTVVEIKIKESIKEKPPCVHFDKPTQEVL